MSVTGKCSERMQQVVPTIPTIGRRKAAATGSLAGAPTGSVFATDTMTGTDATLLTAHTADTGGAWTKHTLYSVAGELQTNRYRCTTGGTACCYIAATPATANYDAAATLVLATDNDSSATGVAGRIDTAANTMYFARYNTLGNVYEVGKLITGSLTLLGTVAGTLTSNVVTLRMRGIYISMLIDGVLASGPWADASITTAGQVGVRSGGTAGAGVGVHLDNFSATNA